MFGLKSKLNFPVLAISQPALHAGSLHQLIAISSLSANASDYKVSLIHLDSILWLVSNQGHCNNWLCMVCSFVHAVDASVCHKSFHCRVSQHIILWSPVDQLDVGPKRKICHSSVTCISN